MNSIQIFQPVVALVLHTCLVLLALGVSRSRAVSGRAVSIKYYTEYQGEGESGRLRLLTRNYINLLEAPVLFYAGALVVVSAGWVDDLFVQLAWGFVAARVLHTLIHVFYNNVNVRFGVFALSNVCLVTFWVRIAMKVF